MGDSKKQMFEAKDEDQWITMADNDFDNTKDTSSSSSSSSSDTTDDASSSSQSSGSLYDLSDLMAQLPIKRGLSKYYQGKSQSFTSLSNVKSIEDLAKKEAPYRRKMKACKSYERGLDNYKSYTLPKAIISKKPSKNSVYSSFPSRRGSFISCRPPLIPAQKNFGC